MRWCTGFVLVLFLLWQGHPASAAPGATEFGVYAGAGCLGRSKMPDFERFSHRTVERTVDALSQEGWVGLESSIDWVIPCWKGSGLKLTLSVPMIPEGGGTLEEALSPLHDETWRHIARSLVANGYPNATVRIGWEFNGDWMPWAAASDPHSYIALFRHIVTTMRTIPGANFTFEWCPNHGLHAMAATDAYPGDDVVDIIGMDVYDEIWSSNHAEPNERWQWYRDQPYGLEWHYNFALAHHKPTAFSEWGTGFQPGGHGAGDDPVFIAGMADWIATSHPLYQSYWNFPSPEFNTLISEGGLPKSAVVFIEKFGGLQESRSPAAGTGDANAH
jgi:hypothetical protein